MANVNLDNVNPKDKEPEDVSDVQEELDELDFPTNLQFDADGNLIDNGEEGDEQEQEGTEEVDEVAEAVVDATQSKPKHKLTAAEIAIIETKKANKLLEKRLKDLETQLAEREQAKVAESGIAKYVEQGHDEETAKRLYKEDQRASVLEERVELLDFREENAEVFAKYPQAKANAKEIMQVVKQGKGFVTAEQICIGLYGSGKPDREARAIAAAKGESTREVDATGRTTSKAERAGNQSKSTVLTPSEVAEKKVFERFMKRPVTAEEYREAFKGK